MKKDVLTVIAVVICVFLVVGEIAIYADGRRCDADLDITSDGANYSVYSPGTDIYNTLVLDNETSAPITELYIYFDKTYISNFVNAVVPVGAKAATQENYINGIIRNLENRGFHEITVLSADGLSDAMLKDLEADFSKGLLTVSGVLPDRIYSGSEDDTIFEWMSSGGSLYWIGNILGEFYATHDELIAVQDYQDLFFGSDCVNTDGVDIAYSAIGENQFGSALSIMNNNVKYGLNTSVLGDDALSIGYTQDGYSSVSFVKFGDGMICVIAGDYSKKQSDDCSQIIAAGLSYNSKIIENIEGTVSRGTAEGKLTLPESGNVRVYIFVGGYFPIYGEFFDLSM